MSDEHDRPGPSSDNRPARRRPPYGMSLRRRVHPVDVTADLRWRRYATPTPPTRSTSNGSDRRARLVLAAGFLACVVLGVWSNAWGDGGAPEELRGATEPTQQVSPAGKPVVSTSPSPAPTVSASASTEPSPRPAAVKSAKRARAEPSGVARPLRHRGVRAEPRKQPSASAGRDKATESKDAPRRVRKTLASLIAARCDKLFPPSRPAFRVRNQLCHRIYGH